MGIRSDSVEQSGLTRRRLAATAVVLALGAVAVLGLAASALAQHVDPRGSLPEPRSAAPTQVQAIGDTTVSRLVAVRVESGDPGPLKEAISRGFSVRTDTLPAFAYREAFSRELTLRVDASVAAVGTDAYSRPFALRSDTATTPFAYHDAFTRQLSVLTDTSSVTPVGKEAYSRPFALRSDTATTPFTLIEAFTRQVSILTDTTAVAPIGKEVLSRPFAVRTDTLGPFAYTEANSRALLAYRTSLGIPFAAACSNDSLKLHWSRTAGFNFYRVYLAASASAAAVFDSVSVGADTTAAFATGLTEGVRYFVRLGGSQDGGNTFVEFTAFNTGTLIDRTTPSVGIPELSLANLNDTVLRVGLSGSDNTGITAYRVQVFKDGVGGPLARDTMVVGASEVLVTVAQGAKYVARAQASDCAGNVTAFSAGSLPAVVPGLVTFNVDLSSLTSSTLPVKL